MAGDANGNHSNDGFDATGFAVEPFGGQRTVLGGVNGAPLNRGAVNAPTFSDPAAFGGEEMADTVLSGGPVMFTEDGRTLMTEADDFIALEPQSAQQARSSIDTASVSNAAPPVMPSAWRLLRRPFYRLRLSTLWSLEQGHWQAWSLRSNGHSICPLCPSLAGVAQLL